jgi:hypothetical protein
MAPNGLEAAHQHPRRSVAIRTIGGLLSLCALIACSTTEKPLANTGEFAACTSTLCRDAWVVEHWEHEPQRVANAIGSFEDPLEQIVLIRSLTKLGGGDLAVVCDQIRNRSVVAECTKLRSRPHLNSASPPTSRGRNFGGLMLPDGAMGPFADVTPRVNPECANKEPGERRACQQNDALQLAGNRQATEAAAACSAIGDATWKSECLFRVAETVFGLQDVESTRTAVRMCLSSTNFAGQCMSHLSRDLSTKTPEPVLSHGHVWSTLTQRIDAVNTEAAIGGEAYRRGITERFWAQVLTTTFMRSQRIDGTVLWALPDEAKPHARAALALRMVQEPNAATSSLEGLHRQLTGAFKKGAHTTFVTAPEKNGGQIRVTWNTRQPRERDLPTITFLRIMRRAHAVDREADAVICLIEAFGQVGDVPVSIIESALTHPSVLVRWTAARLTPMTDLYASARQTARTDTDSLVRDRASEVTAPAAQ